MKLLDRSIIRQFLSTAMFSLIAVLLVFIIIDVMEKLDDFIDKQAGWGIIVQYYFFFIPEIIKLIIPVAMLLASLFVTARLSTQNELTAMKSSGISLYRIMAPLRRSRPHRQRRLRVLQRVGGPAGQPEEISSRARVPPQGRRERLGRKHLHTGFAHTDTVARIFRRHAQHRHPGQHTGFQPGRSDRYDRSHGRRQHGRGIPRRRAGR
jgi:hypothetical protein